MATDDVVDTVLITYESLSRNVKGFVKAAYELKNHEPSLGTIIVTSRVNRVPHRQSEPQTGWAYEYGVYNGTEKSDLSRSGDYRLVSQDIDNELKKEKEAYDKEGSKYQDTNLSEATVKDNWTKAMTGKIDMLREKYKDYKIEYEPRGCKTIEKPKGSSGYADRSAKERVARYYASANDNTTAL